MCCNRRSRQATSPRNPRQYAFANRTIDGRAAPRKSRRRRGSRQRFRRFARAVWPLRRDQRCKFGGFGRPNSRPPAGAAVRATAAAASRAGREPAAGRIGAGGSEQGTDALRVIPDDQNNAVLVYGTERELATMQAMLRKIDILPLQVRIDAVIAEVTLNDIFNTARSSSSSPAASTGS